MELLREEQFEDLFDTYYFDQFDQLDQLDQLDRLDQTSTDPNSQPGSNAETICTDNLNNYNNFDFANELDFTYQSTWPISGYISDPPDHPCTNATTTTRRRRRNNNDPISTMDTLTSPLSKFTSTSFTASASASASSIATATASYPVTVPVPSSVSAYSSSHSRNQSLASPLQVPSELRSYLPRVPVSSPKTELALRTKSFDAQPKYNEKNIIYCEFASTRTKATTKNKCLMKKYKVSKSSTASPVLRPPLKPSVTITSIDTLTKLQNPPALTGKGITSPLKTKVGNPFYKPITDTQLRLKTNTSREKTSNADQSQQQKQSRKLSLSLCQPPDSILMHNLEFKTELNLDPENLPSRLLNANRDINNHDSTLATLQDCFTIDCFFNN
ncbi:predicted protein [Lodderomyces elongisporus NRRL YB-4239]|uniref:Uncharacterized protein n=1 Tax=Lodderomyces elongisporus (strain ATCC 11503 / CBS 2605 / JCM 1781 / NBRC 1676 / NRRL YB-4239) TaxID=379508 RepID=A5DW74_LODEL|nr:predicted protein [Lodderomyces elongisporus NRRL YB-4239]